MNKANIQTTKAIFPQIYAYTLPTVSDKNGWVKIGYTERQDVRTRIKEQVGTVDLAYDLLWREIAKFCNNQYFTDHLLHSYLKRHKNVKNKPNTEWFFYNGTPLKSLDDFNDFVAQHYNQQKEQSDYQLRQEQQDAVNQTLAYFQENKNGKFLWNAKPRFGKTLTTYDLARQLNAKKVLILTNRPAIGNSWFDDFEQFIAWQTDYVFVSTSESLKGRAVLNREQYTNQLNQPNGKKDIIAFISLQDLKGSIHFSADGRIDKLQWVKELQWDLLVIDEAHEGVDTLKADVALENITCNYVLHLSGTPFKALSDGKFTQDEIYNWSYVDEQSAKLNWSNEDSNPYKTLPTLNLFSYQMSAMISDEVNKGADIEGQNLDFAFDLNEFFATNDKGKFEHEKEVKKWLDTLSKNEKYPFSTKALRDEIKHSFWLLERIDSAKALAKLLNNHPVFENYHIILAVGDGRFDNETVNQNALQRVKEAIKNHDKTITLSVGQLTTGVTIPEWTAVLMLSNVKSPAQYWQTAFRAQNPWVYEKDGQVLQKKNAYVFDFAPERTLIIYDEFANNLLSSTSNGGGTENQRKDNIKQLLNFFPVIAEDSEGKMVELDVNQVLTIPKLFKANQVVRQGFMSNLLFQNISGIFGANSEVLEILEQIEPYDNGKINKEKVNKPIDTQGVQVDDDGNAVVDNKTVINTNNARFGEKVYGDIQTATKTIIQNENLHNDDLAKKVTDIFTQTAFVELAKDNGLTEKFAQKVVKEQSQAIIGEIQKIQSHSQIAQNQIKAEYENDLKNAQSDDEKQQIQKDYEIKTQIITQDLQNQISQKVGEKVAEFTQNSTETILQKAEQNKQNTVEDDVRGRLRGFSRTIPSFLMAYGNKNTTLANFDNHISDSVFKEVTGITLDQFRLLRDKHQFFDEQVFDTSVQEFLNKRFDLANYFEHQKEDIFDYIPPQKTNQIFTPKWVVKMMIDKFEQENPNIFKNPDLTFADLYMKSGLYMTEIVKRLYIGLENQFPNPTERLKHIFANQVYGFAPSEIIYQIAKNFILGFADNQHIKHNIVMLDTTPYAESLYKGGDLDFNKKLTDFFGKAMKFDVIVGNPPYQENAKGESTKDTPIYHHFYELAEKHSDKYCLISPARFLFNAGSTDKNWNEKMLNDKHIKVVYYEQKSDNLFSNTDIKGGIAILYRDIYQDFGKVGTFTTFSELNTISLKVGQLAKDTLDEIVTNRGQYRYSDKIYKDYPSEMTQISDRRIASNAFIKLPNLFTDKIPNDGGEYIQILGRFENDRCFKWFKRAYLSEPENLGSFKVILPKANGSGAIGEVLSTPLIGEPLIGYTETFVAIGCFDNRLEAENCLKYIKSKFARTMLGILKITQDNTKEKWSKVPLQDFTNNSDIDWTVCIADIDKQLYAKYGLSDDEIAFIESKVKAME
ncbi:Eco57I restriction-modification methylase domain-containing protein [Moraxella sp. Pampa]|uniref:Eco57I restriction-modification methylase domain-containing protein n=1 Tax=Moraxella sp. Pampa TaxID=3111978 RepID=UPI002B400F7D|nr:Eco57I restriction-modification methylase domain-containing protein [Moraxella sp. Pampa]